MNAERPDGNEGWQDEGAAGRRGSRHRPPVRVGLLVDGSEDYGVRVFMTFLARSLDRRAVHLAGLFLGPGPSRTDLVPLCDEVYDLGTGCLLPLTRLGRSRYSPFNALSKGATFAKAVWAATRAIRVGKLDVLHVNMYPMHLVAGLACRLAKTPCLWHWHGPYRPRGPLGLAARFGFRRLATRIACISHFVQRTLPADVQAKCRTVHNGVHAGHIAEHQKHGALRGRLAVAAGQPLVALFGSIAERKGHAYFLRAAATVVSRIPAARFAIVGGEHPHSRQRYGLERGLRQLARELGLSDAVRFCESIPEAPLYMGDCDVVCMPTIPMGDDTGEGFGLVMIEAMAAGVPVVATTCGAPPEVIEDGVSGRLVPPRDADALAAAILWLLEDEARRIALGRAAQQRVAACFTVERLCRAVEGLYEECRAARSGYRHRTATAW